MKYSFVLVTTTLQLIFVSFNTIINDCHALVPLIDGGKTMPKLYDGWFNDQIVKQANTALSKAIAAGKVCNKSFQ